MEAAGLVLGGFSLVISAMEHYATMEKMGRTWWKIRREHTRDLGRLRDCELLYRANMRTLLAPLQLDGTIDSVQLELLLSSLEDKGWHEDEVELVLSKRLGERKERYFDNLREMNETIMKLAKVSMAMDKRFQATLGRGDQKHDPVANAARSTMLRANDQLYFELKRATSTLTMFKRESLLKDIERCNNTIKDFLSIRDGTQEDESPSSRAYGKTILRKYRPLLSFWKHADRIHHLMQRAWQCACSSLHCVHVQLDQHSVGTISLDMVLRYCDKTSLPQIRPWENLPLSVTRAEPPEPVQPRRPLKIKFNLPNIPAQQTGASTSPGATAAKPSSRGIDARSPTRSNTPQDGLCLLAKKSQSLQLGVCICTLIDQATNDSYELSTANTTINGDEAYSLTEIFTHRCAFELLHMHRLLLAFNIANAFLKLCATPWLDESAKSTAVYIPVAPDGQRLLPERAFVLSHFHHAQPSQPNDDMFVLLGILLLELCLNKTLEQHPQWQAYQQLSSSTSDLVARRAIASTWVKSVKDMWLSEGTSAINWCLHLASVQNDSWREELASKVVEPLRALCKDSGLNVGR